LKTFDSKLLQAAIAATFRPEQSSYLWLGIKRNFSKAASVPQN